MNSVYQGDVGDADTSMTPADIAALDGPSGTDIVAIADDGPTVDASPTSETGPTDTPPTSETGSTDGDDSAIETQHPQLAIAVHGDVQWTSARHIVVTYDWSSEAQLADWVLNGPGQLTRNPDNTVSINEPGTTLECMLWQLPITATRIIARAKTKTSNHINIYTNLDQSWHGENWAPNPGLGIIYADWTSYAWIDTGQAFSNEFGMHLANNLWYSFELRVSPTSLQAYASLDEKWYEHSGTFKLYAYGRVALGAFNGDSVWDKLTIEGDINY